MFTVSEEQYANSKFNFRGDKEPSRVFPQKKKMLIFIPFLTTGEIGPRNGAKIENIFVCVVLIC